MRRAGAIDLDAVIELLARVSGHHPAWSRAFGPRRACMWREPRTGS